MQIAEYLNSCIRDKAEVLTEIQLNHTKRSRDTSQQCQRLILDAGIFEAENSRPLDGLAVNGILEICIIGDFQHLLLGEFILLLRQSIVVDHYLNGMRSLEDDDGVARCHVAQGFLPGLVLAGRGVVDLDELSIR